MVMSWVNSVRLCKDDQELETKNTKIYETLRVIAITAILSDLKIESIQENLV